MGRNISETSELLNTTNPNQTYTLPGQTSKTSNETSSIDNFTNKILITLTLLLLLILFILYRMSTRISLLEQEIVQFKQVQQTDSSNLVDDYSKSCLAESRCDKYQKKEDIHAIKSDLEDILKRLNVNIRNMIVQFQNLFQNAVLNIC